MLERRFRRVLDLGDRDGEVEVGKGDLPVARDLQRPEELLRSADRLRDLARLRDRRRDQSPIAAGQRLPGRGREDDASDCPARSREPLVEERERALRLSPRDAERVVRAPP